MGFTSELQSPMTDIWAAEASRKQEERSSEDGNEDSTDDFFTRAKTELQSRIEGHEQELEIDPQPGWYTKDEVPDMDVAAEQPRTDVPDGIRGLLSRLEVENQASLQV